MGRYWSRMCAMQLIILALKTQVAFSTPYFSNHVDRFAESGECLRRATSRASIGMGGIRESSGAESQLKTAAAEQVNARSGFCHDRRRTKRQIRDIGKKSDTRGGGSNHA